MIRGLSAFLVLLAGVALAQQPAQPAAKATPTLPHREVGQLAQAQGVGGVYRLTIEPAPAPVPALRYRLLPELRERTPGNGAVLYYRSFSPEWMVHRRPEVNKLIIAWLDDKTQPPDIQLRWVLDSKQLKEVDRAARREYCEWEQTPRLREDGIGLLLPDVQSFREFANLLNLRFRFQLDEGRIDDAVYTLQTGFSLSRDIANAPTLIQSLVGLAIAAIQLGQVEELMQASKSPNLYWALTNLPQPFISLRKAFEGERIMMDNLFPGMLDALAKGHSKPLTAEESKALADKLVPIISQEGKLNPADVKKQMDDAVAKQQAEAKKYLTARGWPAKEVDALPPGQAVLLYQIGEYVRLYDEMAKCQGLPYWEMRASLNRAEKVIKDYVAKQQTVGGSLAQLLLPAMQKVIAAQVRVDRRIAALRCVEAVRLYAAAHDGKAPAKLEDIRTVPIPLDPYTGKAFTYKAEKNSATIEGPAPNGEPATINNRIRYEVTLKSKDAMK
jgi:hypothetical protein